MPYVNSNDELMRTSGNYKQVPLSESNDTAGDILKDTNTRTRVGVKCFWDEAKRAEAKRNNK